MPIFGGTFFQPHIKQAKVSKKNGFWSGPSSFLGTGTILVFSTGTGNLTVFFIDTNLEFSTGTCTLAYLSN